MSEEMNLYKRCKNIFKFHGVDMGGGGGESAPEVENAIETHGLGWTSEEEVEGFDIQWDGNTEGHESYADMYFKITDDLSGINSIDDLVGAIITLEDTEQSETYTYTLDNTYLREEYGAILVSIPSFEQPVPFLMIASDDLVVYETPMSKGIWGIPYQGTLYVSRLYKEASTEETVHQIDQKYIPGGSGGAMVVTLTVDEKTAKITADKTLQELQPLINSDAMIIAKVTMGDSYSIFWPLVHYEEEEGVPSEAYFGYMTYNSTTDSSKPTLQATLNEYGVTEWTSWYFN